jgi:hypothetical protein
MEITLSTLRQVAREEAERCLRHYFDPVTVPARWIWRKLSLIPIRILVRFSKRAH